MRRSKGAGRQGPTDRPQQLKSVLPEAGAGDPIQKVPLPHTVHQPPPSSFLPLGLPSLQRSPSQMKMTMWLKKGRELLVEEIKLIS